MPTKAETIKANYKINFGLFKLGHLSWEIDLEKNIYESKISLESRGLASGLYKFNGNYYSKGIIKKNIFVPTKYTQLWTTKKKVKKLELYFSNGWVYSLKIAPKENELPRINYLNLKNLKDPVSSLMNILNKSGDEFTTIDGRRVYVMKDGFKDAETRRVTLSDYKNIWADHNKNALEYLEIRRLKENNVSIFPEIIKIKHQGFLFKLTKI